MFVPEIHVNELIWDKWNIDHIHRHKVVPAEVEEVCHGAYVVRETYKDRIMLIGKTNKGKFLAIVLEEKMSGIYYPVTARTADRKERKNYYEELEVKDGKK